MGKKYHHVEQALNLVKCTNFTKWKAFRPKERKWPWQAMAINEALLYPRDFGIAKGTVDVAIENAAITLVKGDLNGIVKARLLIQNVMRNIKENLFFALGYNVLGIPIAA